MKGMIMTGINRPNNMVITVLLAMVLAACNQAPVKEPAIKARSMPFNIVSTGDSQAQLLSASTFSWMPGMQTVREDPRLGATHIQEQLKDSIVLALADKGYSPAPAGESGDLLVGYVVTLSNNQEATDLEAHYGVHASINLASPDPRRYEKGTLIIDIIERNTGLTAWRSALQGFADMDISEAERHSRLNSLVKRMLAGMPAHAPASLNQNK